MLIARPYVFFWMYTHATCERADGPSEFAVIIANTLKGWRQPVPSTHRTHNQPALVRRACSAASLLHNYKIIMYTYTYMYVLLCVYMLILPRDNNLSSKDFSVATTLTFAATRSIEGKVRWNTFSFSHREVQCIIHIRYYIGTCIHTDRSRYLHLQL